MFDHLVNNENGKDFVNNSIFLYPRVVSCAVILAFTETITCFEVVMFHVLTSCVSFDYVVDCENTHPNNHKPSRDFHTSFDLTSYNQSFDYVVNCKNILPIILGIMLLSQVLQVNCKFLTLTRQNQSINHGKTYSQTISWHIKNSKQDFSQEKL